MTVDRRITARGIIFRDGKIFLQKLHNSNGANGFWSTPGGKLDPAEKLEDGAHRELIEETGVEPKVGRLLFVQQFFDAGGPEFIEFFYHIENPEDYETIDLTSTTHGVEEVAEFGFVDPKTEYVLPAFLSKIDIQDYIDNIKPVYFYYDSK